MMCYCEDKGGDDGGAGSSRSSDDNDGVRDTYGDGVVTDSHFISKTSASRYGGGDPNTRCNEDAHKHIYRRRFLRG